MAEIAELQDSVDIEVQKVLLAASLHDIAQLRVLLRSREQLVNAQDSETGFTALHAAIASCEDESPPETNGVNGQHVNGATFEPEHASTIDAAKATVQWLLHNGAIWNIVDSSDETPGCLAYRINALPLYELMVEAGTRAELLLSRLDEYEAIAEGDLDDNQDEQQASDDDAVDSVTTRTEALGLENDPAANNETFLRSDLTFQPSMLLDRDANGVMMDWETDIMQRTANLLLPSAGLRVLNIGHGMGIIDTMFQAKRPSSHHIIEAHPAVIERMKSQGWTEKPGVQIHEGRWQDVVPKLIEGGIEFDAIFYDTFAEDYRAFKQLFEEHLLGLLDDAGSWSFFNGLGADRQISYDVYRNIVAMDLLESGWQIEWTTLDVPDLASQGTWQDTKRPYWTLKHYQLPVCTFAG